LEINTKLDLLVGQFQCSRSSQANPHRFQHAVDPSDSILIVWNMLTRDGAREHRTFANKYDVRIATYQDVEALPPDFVKRPMPSS
jgi:hypothetical protein